MNLHHMHTIEWIVIYFMKSNKLRRSRRDVSLNSVVSGNFVRHVKESDPVQKENVVVERCT